MVKNGLLNSDAAGDVLKIAMKLAAVSLGLLLALKFHLGKANRSQSYLR
jgi:hypothetical protein